MNETLLKPMGKDTPAEVIAENTADLNRLFELRSEQLTGLFTELVKNKETFTVAKLASMVGVKTSRAANLYETFLDIIHLSSTHGTTPESMAADLKSIGIEEGKIQAFLTAMKGLDDEVKRAADVLATASGAVDHYPHISQLGYDLTYLEVPKFQERDMKSVLPIVVLHLTLSESASAEGAPDQTKTIQIHLPITEMERLSKSIDNMFKDAREQVRRFKKETGIKFFIPEG